LALELEFEAMVVFETIVAVPFATLGIAVGPAPFERVTVLRMVCGGCVTVEVTFCPATSWVIVFVAPGCVRTMTITCTELEDEELDDELEELDEEDDDPAPAWPLVLEFELPSPDEPAEDDEPVLPLEDEDKEPLEDEDDETDPEPAPDETIVAPGAEGSVAAGEVSDCGAGGAGGAGWAGGAGMFGLGAAESGGEGGAGIDIALIEGAGSSPAALGAPAVMVAVHMLTVSVIVTAWAAPWAPAAVHMLTISVTVTVWAAPWAPPAAGMLAISVTVTVCAAP
jgi:hypothetical protein